ncbi:hypothetical protein NGA_0514600 [Nannochloropsis gaditana CCMP526]|uniref:Transmembrane protein n=1 Tax=Nannochloropsis gaditana TaxID=72520 RepID=W7TZB0_9STRA|nr:hypothetical protein NGA_0514600 [Nannochloropsis gaditana CCMP526]EKU20320.1 hypothetical protein NGA_0514600 [Nannochloropsis gaditana CCMP526]EWM25966.1 Protein of unknown function DUF3464 [Nannochloropsis gaditana]|eukprot:XP_005856027.1 hypothetical protein NGA_0514600 [Nannochloropsis gaditana CCMP526]
MPAAKSRRSRLSYRCLGAFFALAPAPGAAFAPLSMPSPFLQSRRHVPSAFFPNPSTLPTPFASVFPLHAAAEEQESGQGKSSSGPKGFGRKTPAQEPSPSSSPASTSSSEPDGPSNPLSASQASLQELDRLNARQKKTYWEIQKEMEREMDMREIDEYKETQRLLDEGVVGYLPERISNRMLKRLLPFILFPVLGGIGLFGFYLYLAKNTEIDVPPAFVAFSTQVPFLAALVGITYSIMSTSWEPEVEGSFWGFTEFKANVLNLLDSLQKTKREESAKEKMEKYSGSRGPNRAKRRELDRLSK